MNIFSLYGKIKLQRVGDTIQLDGRCDYRKSKGNRSKRSLSGHLQTREWLVTTPVVSPSRVMSAVTGKQKSPFATYWVAKMPCKGAI